MYLETKYCHCKEKAGLLLTLFVVGMSALPRQLGGYL